MKANRNSHAMRIIFNILVLLLSVPTLCIAQEKENYRWQVNLYAGIYIENEQAWILEPSVTWNFHKYLGVSLGCEFTSQYNQPGRSTTINGKNADLLENNRNIGWVLLKPALIVKSPMIKLDNEGIYKLWFQGEPGISLACPFRNSLTYRITNFGNSAVSENVTFRNKGLRVFYWNARISAQLAIDRWTVGIGYEISDFDYYSCRRKITLQKGHKFKVPKKEMSQSILLTAGYKF